jgi:hypothetical protein
MRKVCQIILIFLLAFTFNFISIVNSQPYIIDNYIRETSSQLFEGISGDQVNPGDVWLIDIGHSVDDWAMQNPALIVCLKTLLKEDAKLVIIGSSVDSHQTYTKIMNELEDVLFGKIYGIDYVYLGINPNGESGIAHLAIDLTIFPLDYYGTPVSSLPLISDFIDSDDRTWEYISGILSTETDPPRDYFERQWVGPYATKLGLIFSDFTNTTYKENMRWFFGICYGDWGGAELERLISEPGEATSRVYTEILQAYPGLVEDSFSYQRYNELHNLYNDLVSEYSLLENDFDAISDDYAELSNEHDSLKGEVDRLSSELSTALLKIDSLESQLEEMNGGVIPGFPIQALVLSLILVSILTRVIGKRNELCA